jgi:ribosome biogenesis protein NSA1
MAVGTAYKQVRLYDVRENSKMRRPTQTTPEGLLEYRVTSLCQTSDHELVVGDGAGYIYSLDLRRLGRDLKAAANKDMGRYVGPAGSVRQLKKHPTLPRLAAVGLDRMLRIYDTKKRLQLDCIYLKQRINCVLMHSDGTWDGNGSAVDVVDPEDVDIDQDDIVQEYVDSDASDEDDDGNEIEGGFNSADGSENEDASSDSENDDENTEKEEKEDERLGGVNKSEKVRERLKNTGVDKQQESNNQSDSNKNDDEEDDDDDDNESEGSSPEESMEGSDEEDEDDEVIVVQAPKRRRRH